MSVTTVGTSPRLTFVQTVSDSIMFLYRHRKRFIPLVVALAAILSLLQPLLGQVASDDVRVALVCLVHQAVYACLAYAWCRLVLLGEWVFDGGGLQVPFSWMQFRGFACYYALICFGILTLAAVLAIALAPTLGLTVGSILSGLFFTLLIARLSFVLPATAIQLPTSFLESWHQTTGLGVRLWSLYASALVPAAAVLVVMGAVFSHLAASTAITIPLWFVTWCAALMALLVVVTMMSIAYERIVGLPARARRLDRLVGE